MGKVKRDAPLPLFLTLTYPDEFPTDPQKWARDLEAFAKRLDRKCPDISAIWRRDMRIRLSGVQIGQVAPHFHILLWGLELPWNDCERKALYKWISRAWYEVVGLGDERHLHAGTRIEQIRTWRGVTHYVSKYLTKLEQSDLAGHYPDGTGRWWGVWYRSRMPFGEVVFVTLTDEEAIKLIRLLRRVIQRKGRAFVSLSAITGDGDFWLSRVIPWTKGVQGSGSMAGLDELSAHIRAQQ